MLFLICCVCINATLIGQTRLRACVVDATTTQAIPFPTVVSHPSGNVVFADERGCFQIETSPNDTIEIRFIGYYSLRTPASELSQNAIISLTPKIFDLPEIVISPRRYRWTPFQGEPYRGALLANQWGPHQTGTEFVSLVQFSNTDLKTLQRIRIRMSRVQPLILSRLTLYEVCASGEPGRTLLRQPILIEPKHIRRRGREIQIDLSSYNITFEGSEIFAGIEFLPFEESGRMGHWPMTLVYTHIEADRILTFMRGLHIDNSRWRPNGGSYYNQGLRMSFLISVQY